MEKGIDRKADGAEEKVSKGCLRKFRLFLNRPVVYYLKTLIRLYPERFPNTQCLEKDRDDVNLQTIHPQNNEHELAVYLNSHGINIIMLEDMIRQIIGVRKELKQLREKEIELAVIPHATRNELISVLNNPDVQHVVVSGHGSWNTWVDNNFKEVKNTDLEMEKGMPKKKTFIRATCGSIYTNDEFEDQFGTPFSEEVYGRHGIVKTKKAVSKPVVKTSKNEFELVKDQKIIRPNIVKIAHLAKHFPKFFIGFQIEVFKSLVQILSWPITIPYKICRLLFRGVRKNKT